MRMLVQERHPGPGGTQYVTRAAFGSRSEALAYVASQPPATARRLSVFDTGTRQEITQDRAHGSAWLTQTLDAQYATGLRR